MRIPGKFIGNERGFGFVSVDGGEDVFISPVHTNGALHGDEVLCKVEKNRDSGEEKRKTGVITEITRRQPMVGTFFTEGRFAFVRAAEKRIPYTFEVPPKTVARFSLADGHRVVFSVDKRVNPAEKLAACFITEVIGHVNDPGVDVLTLVRMAGVPFEFPQETMEEAAEMPVEVNPDGFGDRLDLRSEFIFTIDGDDTKDIDDAISFAKTGDGFRLGVHIADVCHYVREDSALDASAFRRGTSIYLADRVIPMLPHSLSSGICSLFPNVDRLALSCLMTVDSAGNVTDYEIVESLIHSKRRYTYGEVQEILDGGGDVLINAMDELRGILKKKREKRGALDFDLPETKIRVDEEGRVISVEPYPRSLATGIIEEFMILCNETVAAHFLAKKIPFVYRTHEEPSAEKIATLHSIIQNFGFRRPTAKTLQKLLDAAKDSPGAYAVSTAVLQSLPQAHYTPENPTHFGLASEAYCHFTSPIRRYADLMVHRIIKENLGGKVSSGKALDAVCKQCSRTERVAEALERDVAELKKVQFMSAQTGQTFDAIVSGVTPWGAYVMLPNTAEGLISASNLKYNRYKFDKDMNAYQKSKREYLHHGTAVRVKLISTNEDERKINFVLASEK